MEEGDHKFSPSSLNSTNIFLSAGTKVFFSKLTVSCTSTLSMACLGGANFYSVMAYNLAQQTFSYRINLIKYVFLEVRSEATCMWHSPCWLQCHYKCGGVCSFSVCFPPSFFLTCPFHTLPTEILHLHDWQGHDSHGCCGDPFYSSFHTITIPLIFSAEMEKCNCYNAMLL